MKLKDYIKNLQNIVEQNPDYADLDVITEDDEGNGFHTIYFTPSVGMVDEDYESFVDCESEDFSEGDYEINCVCVN